MSGINNILQKLNEIAHNPKAQMERYIADGRKIVGCLPYFCPEELVHAGGMTPFGLWGAEVRVSEAKKYWPAFICSILQTTLELGMRGEYDGLEAVMIPILCDSLKGMTDNWRFGVRNVPVIPVAHAQNRKTPAGVDFTASQYRKIRSRLEELSGNGISDGDIAGSVAVFNDRRAVMRRFQKAAGQHPGLVKPSLRNAVFKAGYFMDVGEHTEIVYELNRLLEQSPAAAWSDPKIVTSGIIADHSDLLKIMDDCGIAVVDDEVTHESLRYRTDVPVTSDPTVGLARQIGNVEGCPVLFDPGKNRGAMLVELAKKSGADGVLLVQTKFCDPEEYDYVPIKAMLDRAGIRNLQVEVDQQTRSLEQARTAIETFCETL